MGIAKRRLPLNVAPSCCWILHRSCVNKSWRDNARMWVKHPRWIFFQMTLSFRVLIAISCFCQHKLTCQLLRINMQNTYNLISKIQEPEKWEALREVRGRKGDGGGVLSLSQLRNLHFTSIGGASCFTAFWCEIGFRFNAKVSPLIVSYKGFEEQRMAHRRCLSAAFVMIM